MLASELPDFGDWLKTSPVSSDRLWARKLEVISDAELQLFYARCGLIGLKKEAVEAIDRLQTALVLAAMHGSVSQAALRLVTHEPPLDRFTVDEFIDGLIKLRPHRRAAVLYALQGRQTPDEVAGLTWHDIKRMVQVPKRQQPILDGQSKVRHLRLPYVFWEWATPALAAPIVDLGVSASDAFGCSWPALQVRFDDMLWISGRADAASFLGISEEIATGRL